MTITVEKPASKGIALENVFINREIILDADETIIDDSNKQAELDRFSDAVATAVKQIEVLAKDNDIFAAHLEVVQDITLIDGVNSKISDNNKNAELALVETKDEICALFDGIDDEYLKERVFDIKDVCKRLLCTLKNVPLSSFDEIKSPVIVVAKDLTPSDTTEMDFSKVKGFITEVGGVTSHVCIIARSLGIPAIVGIGDEIKNIKENDFLILDAIEGNIFINPSEGVKTNYRSKKEEYTKKLEELEKLNGLPAETTDGRNLLLFANVGSIEDVKNAVERGAEGIGLFRSEFLYMESSSDFPSEDKQFEVYKEAAILMQGKTVIVRTLDIGGDKELGYYAFDPEENPFLGWRAIRICLDMPEMFKSQLKALLRASAFGDIKIMYPMIISVDEVKRANAILDECKKELRENNIEFNEDIEVGIMIETPAAVICAEELAQEVDFFSIGTNDLTQYILAVDRGNEKISKLYDSFNPAILKCIKMVIDAGHKYNKLVGMCGEFASDEKALPILLGMGLDEFSMTAFDIPNIRYNVRNLSYEECKKLV